MGVAPGVGEVTGGTGGGGDAGTSVGSAVSKWGREVALETGPAVSSGVGEPTGTATGATGVGLGCVGAQLDRDAARSAIQIRLVRRGLVLSSMSISRSLTRSFRLFPAQRGERQE